MHNRSFIRYQKEFSAKLSEGIKNSYKEGCREENIVKFIENIVNSVKYLPKNAAGGRKNLKFSISTNSIFIHGNRSQVRFKYYGDETRREIGDIIFILSVVCKDEKIFEKMTINQVKKSKTMSWNFNNRSSKEQLYLLSRFPTFSGADKSLIPNKDYYLPNISGCLGTHGLLYQPGDFAIVSSRELEAILAGRNRLELSDLVERSCSKPTLMYDEECIYKFCRFDYRHDAKSFSLMQNLPVMGNSCIAFNAHDFSNKYLTGNIGELIYASNFSYNRPAFWFLHELLAMIESKAKREKEKNLLEFVNSFYRYRYNHNFDRDRVGGIQGNIDDNESYYEGGGIGIVHTTIDLGTE